MTSSDVQVCSNWTAWSQAAAKRAPEKPGVYFLRLGNSLERLKGSSDLLYIGTTEEGKGTVRARLISRFREVLTEGSVGYRLARFANEVPGACIEFAWRVLASHEDAMWDEAQLLKRYEDDHIELPPLNRQQSGNRPHQAQKALEALGLRPGQAEYVVKNRSKLA